MNRPDVEAGQMSEQAQTAARSRGRWLHGAGPSLLVGYKAASDLVGKASVFLIVVLAAKRLPTDAFGLFSLATTLGWLLSVATDFGLQLYLAREVARQPDSAARVLRPLLTLRTRAGAAAVAVVAVGSALWFDSLLALGFSLIVLAQMLGAMVEFLNYFYRGLSRSDLESTLNLAQRLVALAAVAAVLAVSARLELVGLALVLPAAVTFVGSRRLALEWAGAPETVPDRAARPSFARTNLREVVPIGVGVLLSALYFRIDLFLIDFWQGVEAVALYNAVFRLVEALRLFPAAVIAVAFPELTRARDPWPLVRISALLVGASLVALPLADRLAPWLIGAFYGPRYLDAVPVFRILLLALPLLFLNYALTHQLVGWDGQRLYAALCGAALALNLGLNAFLIPAGGIAGAAWATLWTEVFLTAGCAASLWIAAPRRASAVVTP